MHCDDRSSTLKLILTLSLTTDPNPNLNAMSMSVIVNYFHLCIHFSAASKLCESALLLTAMYVLSAEVVRAACWPFPYAGRSFQLPDPYLQSMMLKQLTRTRTRPGSKISTQDYIGTGDSHNPTFSQSHRPIIPLPNGNRIGKLRVYWYTRGSGLVGSDSRAYEEVRQTRWLPDQ